MYDKITWQCPYRTCRNTNESSVTFYDYTDCFGLSLCDFQVRPCYYYFFMFTMFSELHIFLILGNLECHDFFFLKSFYLLLFIIISFFNGNDLFGGSCSLNRVFTVKLTPLEWRSLPWMRIVWKYVMLWQHKEWTKLATLIIRLDTY